MDQEHWSDFLLTSYVKPEDDKWPEQIVPPGSRMVQNGLSIDNHKPAMDQPVSHMEARAAPMEYPGSHMGNLIDTRHMEPGMLKAGAEAPRMNHSAPRRSQHIQHFANSAPYVDRHIPVVNQQLIPQVNHMPHIGGHQQHIAHPISPYLQQLHDSIQQTLAQIAPMANWLRAQSANPHLAANNILPGYPGYPIRPINEEYVPLDSLNVPRGDVRNERMRPQLNQPSHHPLPPLEIPRNAELTGLLQRIRNDAERVQFDDGKIKVKQEKPDINPNEFMAMAKAYVDGVAYYNSKIAQNRNDQQSVSDAQERKPFSHAGDETLLVQPACCDDDKTTKKSGDTPHDKPHADVVSSTQEPDSAVETATPSQDEISSVVSVGIKCTDDKNMDPDSDTDSIHSPKRHYKHTIHHYPTPADLMAKDYLKQTDANPSPAYQTSTDPGKYHCHTSDEMTKTRPPIDLSDDSEHSLTDLITNLGRVASFMRATLEWSAPPPIAGPIAQKTQKPSKSPMKKGSKDPRQDILKQAYKKHQMYKSCMNSIIKKQPQIRTCKPRRYDISCFLQKSRYQTKRGKKLTSVRVMNTFSDLKNKRKSDTESLWKLLKTSNSLVPKEKE